MKKMAQVRSYQFSKSNVLPAWIEASITPGLPSFHILGATGRDLQEAKQRVYAAFKHAKFPFPKGKVYIQCHGEGGMLQGRMYDLPIALAILAADGQVMFRDPVLAIGELGLDASLRASDDYRAIVAEKIEGMVPVFPKALSYWCRQEGGLPSYGVESLQEAVQLLQKKVFALYSPDPAKEERKETSFFLSPLDAVIDFPQQRTAWEALSISLAGGHPLLLTGAPGCGKTTILRSAQYLLPSLDRVAYLNKLKRYYLSRLSPPEDERRYLPGLVDVDPQISYAAFSRGLGNHLSVLSMAEDGILLMDEFNQFHPKILELLKKVIPDEELGYEGRRDEVGRFMGTFVLAAMNPCPCGHFSSRKETCRCSPATIEQFWRRIDAALLDRFELFVPMQPLEREDLQLHEEKGACTAEGRGHLLQLRAKILACREVQKQRYPFLQQHALNGKVPASLFFAQLKLQAKVRDYSLDLAHFLKLSARGYASLLRVSRTIADLQGAEELSELHLATAAQFRCNRPRFSAEKLAKPFLLQRGDRKHKGLRENRYAR